MRTAIAVGVAWGAMYLGSAAHAQADFEGIWIFNVPMGSARISDEGLNLTPAGRTEWERYSAEIDPLFRCIMPGVPRGLADPYPLEIIQQEHQIVLLHEYFHQVRRIYMDGRQPPDNLPTSLNGYSTGSWDGETLVVRTTHLSPDNFMDIHGRPFSGAEDTHVVERYSREGDVLSLEAETYDPTYYEQPIRMRFGWALAPDAEIWEYECDPRYGDVLVEDGANIP